MTTSSGPRIAFLGTGAQGAPIAADFTLAGLDVTLIDQWPAHVEAMRADEGSSPTERAAVLAALHERFGMDDGDLRELLAVAEERSRGANDYFAFTSVLNDVLRQEQKVEVVELMWRIAYTDGSADAGESHVISKIAGLLHVPHGDYIAAKMRAKEAREAGRGGS